MYVGLVCLVFFGYEVYLLLWMSIIFLLWFYFCMMKVFDLIGCL